MAYNATPDVTVVGGGQQGQRIDLAVPIDLPAFPPQLIVEPGQTNPAINTAGPLELLIGTWTNQNIGGSGTGDASNPFSYNLMVLPQTDPSSPAGYILKNNTYYEEITFSPVNGAAANRGGSGTQVVNALTYEQRVYFADGPAIDTLVHFENGIWGYLSPAAQALGPYGDGNGDQIGTQTFGTTPADLPYNIFKQISVPHGNSILACGVLPDVVSPTAGAPTIPVLTPIPTVQGLDTSTYTTESVQNPIVDFTRNPNLPLANALAEKTITQFIQINIDTGIGGGAVSNITFEQARAEVVQYYASYWLEDDGSNRYNQLQYSQTIILQIPLMLDGKPAKVLFPHVTTNTLTRGVAQPTSAPTPAPAPTPTPTPG